MIADKAIAREMLAMNSDRRILYAVLLAHEVLHQVGYPETAAALLRAAFATDEAWKKQQETRRD